MFKLPWRRKSSLQSSLSGELSSSGLDQASAGELAAFGALLGVCIGDAAGAPLEYPRCSWVPDERVSGKVEQALQMAGGGLYEVVGPGQGTDDTEATLCLAHALATSTSPHLPLEAIAQNYSDWAADTRLDIGDTCQRSFRAGHRAPKGSIAQACKRAAQESACSQSNDCLNRIVPLAIWAWREDPGQIAALARREASLSHTNQTVQDCSAAYCIAIAQLLKEPGKHGLALEAAYTWAQLNATPEVVEWLSAAQDEASSPPVTSSAGWVKWSFLYAFRHLHQGSSFEAALRDMLHRAGDVDTNAAIVGGVMGALHGFDGIPAALRDPVLARTVDSPGKTVPACLCASQRDLDSQQEVAQTPMGFASFVMRQMVKLHFVIKCTTLHRRMPLSPSRLS